MAVIEFTAPVRIESEANRREHWAARKKRFDQQRAAVRIVGQRRFRGVGGLVLAKALHIHSAPLTVTLTRIGPRTLDGDNLAGGFKAVRDEIAYGLGIDDGDERLTWIYKQEKGRPKEYAIRIRIEPTPTDMSMTE